MQLCGTLRYHKGEQRESGGFVRSPWRTFDLESAWFCSTDRLRWVTNLQATWLEPKAQCQENLERIQSKNPESTAPTLNPRRAKPGKPGGWQTRRAERERRRGSREQEARGAAPGDPDPKGGRGAQGGPNRGRNQGQQNRNNKVRTPSTPMSPLLPHDH